MHRPTCPGSLALDGESADLGLRGLHSRARVLSGRPGIEAGRLSRIARLGYVGHRCLLVFSFVFFFSFLWNEARCILVLSIGRHPELYRRSYDASSVTHVPKCIPQGAIAPKIVSKVSRIIYKMVSVIHLKN